MKKFFSIVLAVIMAMSLAACAPAPAEEAVEAPVVDTEAAQEAANEAIEEKGYADTIYIASEENLETADPYGSTAGCTYQLTNMTFNVLVDQPVGDTNVYPELATSWDDVNGDGTCWDIHLRDDVVFHNGEAMTAADVVFTWEYVTNPENVIKVFTGNCVTACQSVEAIDDYTVRFTLSQPMPDFVSYLAQIKVYSKVAFDTMDPKEAGVIGSGPYVFDAENTKNGIQYATKKFDKYWGDPELYKTNNIVFKVYGSTDTSIAALQTGEVDLMFNVPASQLAVCKSDSNLALHQLPGTYSYYFGFNYNHNEALRDPVLRRAISMAIDKQAMVDVAFEGYADVSDCVVIPIHLGYSDNYTYDYGYDPEGAKKLLEENGYTDLKFTVSYPTVDTKLMCEVLQSQLAAVGIECELLAVDVTNWTAHKKTNEFDILCDAFESSGALLYNVNRFFHSSGGSNLIGYNNPEYDKLQDEVAACTDWNEMLTKFQAVQQFLNDDMPFVPVLYNTFNVVARADVQGQNDTWHSKNLCDFSTLYAPAR